MLDTLRRLFPANRVMALTASIAASATLIAGLAQALPNVWANYALVASALLLKLATMLKFLEGSQKYDQLVGHALSTQPAAPPTLELDAGPDEQDAPQRLWTPNIAVDIADAPAPPIADPPAEDAPVPVP